MSWRERERGKFNLLFAVVFLLIGLGAGAYYAWAYSVSARVKGHVTKYEYDRHGHPSLVVEFTDASGWVRELRTEPCGYHQAPERELGAEVGVLVPPDGRDPLFDEPGASWFFVALWSGLGAVLTLLAWSDLKKPVME